MHFRELLLIDACQIYGLGNWADVAEHVGNGRTKEEVERHYVDVFIFSDDYPLPVSLMICLRKPVTETDDISLVFISSWMPGSILIRMNSRLGRNGG